MTWWQRVWRRDRLEAELDDELRFHFEELVADKVRSGVPAGEARRQAQIEIGGVEQVKEACRDARGTRFVHDIMQDCRYALRLLMKERTLSIGAIIVLSLGIGVNNMLFTIVNAHCIRGLPVKHADRLLYLAATDSKGTDRPLTLAEFDALRSASTLEMVAGFETAAGTLVDNAMPADRVTIAYVSPATLPLMDEQPVLGRELLADDDRAGAPPVALIGDSLWHARYHGEPGILGTPVRVAGVQAVIVGVVRRGFKFPYRADVWLPLAHGPARQGAKSPVRSIEAIGLPTPGVTREQAEEELTALWQKAQVGSQPLEAAPIRLKVSPINDVFNAKLTSPAWLAFFTVGILLVLIACFNVANLLLARSVYREREMSVRRALGASRARILRQLLVEGALLAGCGGALGLFLSAIGLRLFASAIPDDGLPYWIEYTMDGRVIAALALACLGTVLLSGLAPALHSVGRGRIDPLRMSGTGVTAGRGARRWTTVLLTAQLAVSVMLLCSVVGTVRAFLAADRGWPIDGTGIMTMRLAWPPDGHASATEQRVLYSTLRERLQSIPSVSAVGIGTTMPGAGPARLKLAIEGRDGSPAAAPVIPAVGIDQGYFETLGIPISAGRTFTAQDGLPGHPVTIVNEHFARTYIPGADPIGHRIALSTGDNVQGPWLTIVGVSRTVGQGTPKPAPVVYVPVASLPGQAPIVFIRAQGPMTPVIDAAREAIRQIDPDLATYQVRSYADAMWNLTWNARVSEILITAIALIALGLSAAGLSSLTWHGVAQRRHEIGIRMTLGSQPEQVTKLILRDAARQVIYGVMAGCVLTLLWERLFGTPHVFFTLSNLVIVNAFFGALALAMCLWPARHAARVNPLETLQHE